MSFRGGNPPSPLLRPPSGDAYATTQGGGNPPSPYSAHHRATHTRPRRAGGNPPSPLLRPPSGDAYATTQGGANPPSRKPALWPNPTLEEKT